jgi:hypothetical protein
MRSTDYDMELRFSDGLNSLVFILAYTAALVTGE